MTARQAGMVGCTECGRAHPAGTPTCTRCGKALVPPGPESLQKVWAWLLAGIITYIPANIYPMLITNILGKSSSNTIVGGVIELIHHGTWGVAAIVFLASVCIPIGKFLAIAYLAIVARRDPGKRTHARHVLLEVVDFIGRWSMIDVFVVAILTSLVQLKLIANIQPGVAAVSFCASVACTMLAALSFDARLIWNPDEAGVAGRAPAPQGQPAE